MIGDKKVTKEGVNLKNFCCDRINFAESTGFVAKNLGKFRDFLKLGIFHFFILFLRAQAKSFLYGIILQKKFCVYPCLAECDIIKITRNYGKRKVL